MVSVGKRLATSGPGGGGAFISIREQQGMDGDRRSQGRPDPPPLRRMTMEGRRGCNVPPL
eukprot:1232784-Rhodomonas_salina.1